jgi:hypothetical protein
MVLCDRSSCKAVMAGGASENVQKTDRLTILHPSRGVKCSDHIGRVARGGAVGFMAVVFSRFSGGLATVLATVGWKRAIFSGVRWFPKGFLILPGRFGRRPGRTPGRH